MTSFARVPKRATSGLHDEPPGVRTGDAGMERAALALVAAEFGERGAWQVLDDPALAALLGDARRLAATVPLALGRLAAQLALHHEITARLAAVRLLWLVGATRPDEVTLPLLGLLNDATRRVRQAARNALQGIGVAPEAPTEGCEPARGQPATHAPPGGGAGS